MRRPLAAAITLLFALGCAGSAKPRLRPVQPSQVLSNAPSILRGTVGAITTLQGLQPLVVSGYGIVVGLDGTGSTDLSAPIRAKLEGMMAMRGVGSETQGMGWTTPARMINDPDTAVVLVQAIIPPGARKGNRLDVHVTALPGSSTTSLEGGRLWTADLRRGVTAPGAPDTPALARARGDLFINPFADPASESEDSINRLSGRVLNGGVVIKPRELMLVLNTPSHARTRAVASAINTRFPANPVDPEPIARGLDEEHVEINTPSAYRDRVDDFISLMLATRVDLRFPREYARRYINALREQPELANALSWRLQALGPTALPQIRDVYDDADIAPRLAALRAGAGLGDPLAAPYLQRLAREGPPSIRTDAIELLAGMESDPQVNRALRALLDAPELDTRVAAYEALVKRADPSIHRRIVDDKFILDTLPAAEPMVYVTQQQEPRIVLFGAGASLKRPTLVSGWSDRLMLIADSASEPIRLYYRDHISGQTTVTTIKPELADFIEFLGHKPTPQHPSPGLDLTYSQVVGALHEIWKGGGMTATFVAEQDKLAAALINSLKRTTTQDRPETSGTSSEGASSVTPPLKSAQDQGDRPDSHKDKKSDYVVPLRHDPSPK